MILESKKGDRLDLRHLGLDLYSLFWTQRADGTVFEMEGSCRGLFDHEEQALSLMQGPGFMAGDDVEWRGEGEESGVSITVTILQWEYYPAVETRTSEMGGQERVSNRRPHQWKLWFHQKPADTGERKPPPLGFLSERK